MSSLLAIPHPQAASNHNQHLQILDIAIKAKKPLKSVDVLIGEQHKETFWDRIDDQSVRANFNPSLDLLPSDQFSLRLHLHRELLSVKTWKVRDVIISQELLRAVPFKEGNRQECRRMFKGNEITIGLSAGLGSYDGTGSLGFDNPSQSDRLPSTYDEIINICPRFRILVIGKSGVGKSSVINSAYGVNDASVSHSEAGRSDINTEIFSSENDKFVLHDSQGFEPGEVDNLKIVQEFIERRSKMPHIKDKIHAIWLCLEIPRAGGRIFETGVEDFLKLKTTGKLGQIPVIAVFTKYDLLVTRAKRNLDASICEGLSPERLLDLAKKDAVPILKRDCIDPFEAVVQKQVPYMTVSTNDGYRNTLSDLIELTYSHVRKHVAEEVSIVTAIAQKVSPGVKIDGSIAIGIKRYWTGLAASVCFPGKTLEDCLRVIHGDIIAVWTFNDPRRDLYSREFKALMTNMVDDLKDQGSVSPNKGLSVSLSMVGAIAGIVSGLAGPAAPIVIPIAGCFVLAKWTYDVYQQSHGTLRRLMAYIIDLTLVMQNLFWLVTIYRVPVSRRLIKLAAKAYEESEIRVQVHFEIEKHVQEATIIDRAQRDGALTKIIELINLYRIDTAEMFSLKDKIGAFDITGKGEEPWDPSNDAPSGSR